MVSNWWEVYLVVMLNLGVGKGGILRVLYYLSASTEFI